MRQTIVEKIIGEHCGKRAKSGDIVIAKIDFCFGHDLNGAVIAEAFKKLDVESVIENREKFSLVLDHAVPSPNIQAAELHSKIRSFCKSHGLNLYDIDAGISHQVIPEKGHVTCGDIVLAADSHVCTLGALNIFAVGVGAMDIAVTLACGKNWIKVPDTYKVQFEGKPKKGIFAKDIMLYAIKNIGANGAQNKVVEFYGDVLSDYSIESRFTVTNMAANMGAKSGIMAPDRKVLDWVKRHSIKVPKPVAPDEDARYQKVFDFDISDLTPQVACPDSIDNVKSVEELSKTKIDQVFIGSCTNGRTEDLEIAAKILKGKKIAKGIKVVITPASHKIFLDAVKKGYAEIFVKAGAIFNNPGCGPCSGTHQGVLCDGENALTTANSNYKGRMGNKKANIFVSSPATAAATALTGCISDPREFKRKL